MRQNILVPNLGLLLGLSLSSLLPAQTADLYDLKTIRTFGLTFAQTNYWQLLATNYASKTYIKADLVVDGVVYKDVGVRFRGNSSYKSIPATSQKKPFKITMDQFVAGQRLYGYRTINLNNGFRDPTFTREVISCRFYRQFMPSPKANYANLTINGQNWGLYINIQQINKDLLVDYFRDDDGNRYRAERTGGCVGANSGLRWLGTSHTTYKCSYQLKNSTPVNPWNDLINLCNVLNNTPSSTLYADLPKVLDVDESLRYLVGVHVLPAMDSYIWGSPHNYYLYNDGYHGRFVLMPWDLNATFGGNFNLTVNFKMTLSPYYKNLSTYPLIYRLLAEARWKARYFHYYRAMLAGGYDWTTMGGWITEAQNRIRVHLQNDPIKLYTMTQFTQNVTQNVTIRVKYRNDIIPGMKPFIEGRRRYLLALPDIARTAPALSNLGHSPKLPTSKQTVWVNVASTGTIKPATVTLHYRHKGPFVETAMFDDGLHHDGKAGDGVYGASMPPMPAFARVEYFASATASAAQGGAMSLLPKTGGHEPQGYRVWVPPNLHAIRISEFVARNKNGIKDQAGDNDDWLELVNTAQQAIDISGSYLTDDADDPTKWKVPANQVLQPGGTILFWLDGEPGEGPLHTTFKLEGAGEEIAVFQSDGKTPVDGVLFGPQTTDVSMGRIYGYDEFFVRFPQPTPRVLNLPNPCGHLSFVGLPGSTNPLLLSGQTLPKIGWTLTLQLDRAPVSNPALVALALQPFELPLPPLGALLVNPQQMLLLGLTTNGSGTGTLALPIPNLSILVGGVVYFQGVSATSTAGGFSNGLITKICP